LLDAVVVVADDGGEAMFDLVAVDWLIEPNDFWSFLLLLLLLHRFLMCLSFMLFIIKFA
jgi:hypothetical protein